MNLRRTLGCLSKADTHKEIWGKCFSWNVLVTVSWVLLMHPKLAIKKEPEEFLLRKLRTFT